MRALHPRILKPQNVAAGAGSGERRAHRGTFPLPLGRCNVANCSILAESGARLEAAMQHLALVDDDAVITGAVNPGEA